MNRASKWFSKNIFGKHLHSKYCYPTIHPCLQIQYLNYNRGFHKNISQNIFYNLFQRARLKKNSPCLVEDNTPHLSYKRNGEIKKKTGFNLGNLNVWKVGFTFCVLFNVCCNILVKY